MVVDSAVAVVGIVVVVVAAVVVVDVAAAVVVVGVAALASFHCRPCSVGSWC